MLQCSIRISNDQSFGTQCHLQSTRSVLVKITKVY